MYNFFENVKRPTYLGFVHKSFRRKLIVVKSMKAFSCGFTNCHVAALKSTNYLCAIYNLITQIFASCHRL